MKTIRFWMAVLVTLGLVLACLRHAHLAPSVLGAERTARARVLQDNFVWKLRCVNLSGGFARWVLRHRRCNGIYLTPNGMLVKPEEERLDAVQIASNMIACARALRPLSCRTLYVQMPTKQSLDGRGFPASFGENFANANADELLALLGSEMRTVDLRPVVAATAEDVRQNFIRTDHHWNFEGAFKAFQFLIPILTNEVGVSCQGPLPQLERSNWTCVDIPRPGARFLGTRARRTGTWFVGYDTLSYLVPTFPTALRVQGIGQHGETKRMEGDFVHALINWTDLQEPPTFVEDWAYNVYLGDMAFVEITNERAPLAQTVLVVKTSMSQPLLAWMATVFRKVVAVDPRYHHGSLLADVKKTHPDIALFATTESGTVYYKASGHENRVEYGWRHGH